MSRMRTLAGEPRAVWKILADFGALSAWARNVDHSCLLEHGEGDGGVGVGTSRRVQVGHNTLVERITDFEPEKTLGYDIEGLPLLVRRAANYWTLEAAAPGFTAVTVTSTVKIGTNPAANIAERAMCRLMTKQSDEMLAGLARRVEGGR